MKVQQNTTEYACLSSILLIGDPSSGKSRLLDRFADNRYSSGQYVPTIGVEFKSKIVDIGGGTVVAAQCWDTAGEEKFLSVISSFFRGARGFMIVYDITKRSSFENVRRWREMISHHAMEGVAILLVATKCDRESERAVTTKEGEEMAAELRCGGFVETSSCNDINVTKAFHDLIKLVFHKYEPAPPVASSSILSLSFISSKISSFFSEGL